MTDAFEVIGKSLRASPWPVRAAVVDTMLLDSCAIISHRDPLTSVREAVFLMVSNYISLMQAMDEPEIDGVEHAVMLAFFSPRRIEEAAAWGLANNYGGENMVRWLRETIRGIRCFSTC